MGRLVRAAGLAAALLLGLAAVPAEARGGGSGDGWRSVRLCRSEGCWVKHPDGWGPAGRARHGRR